MRKDLQAGTQQDFTAADKIALSVKALQNQTIGIVGTQLEAKNVDVGSQAYLTTLVQSQLTELLMRVSMATTATAKYVHIAYDLNGATVTNFYVGLVVTIDQVPNSAQDLINALNLKFPYLAPLNLKYDAYIIGKPPMGTFHYTQVIKYVTTDPIPVKTLVDTYGSEQQAKTDLSNHILANLQSAMSTAYSQQGINTTIISAEITNLEFKTHLELLIVEPKVKLEVTVKLTLDSDTAFQNSPLIVPVIIAIGVAVSLIVAVYVGIPAITDWLKSMTTKTITSTQKTYGYMWDGTYNADGTKHYVYGLIEEKTETTTEPDLGGIAEIGILVIVAMAVMFLLFMFTQRR